MTRLVSAILHVLFCVLLFIYPVTCQIKSSFLWKSSNRRNRRAVLVVQGQVRSLDLVANMPCDVVLVVDFEGRNNELSIPLLRQLRPSAVFYAEPQPADSRGSVIEFNQSRQSGHQAMSRINISKYDYVIKTRTYVFIAQPLPFVMAVGRSSWTSFRELHRQISPNVTDRQILTGCLAGL